ncbi:hypothetical protein [Streptomyces silvensis]|uniref:hypothetical protein n=1 Tax=Streptomyces silvensis TaxID=1765722 RepID=UPI0012FE9326|nr:hypothetical protein [Streptomyces silvensis]
MRDAAVGRGVPSSLTSTVSSPAYAPGRLPLAVGLGPRRPVRVLAQRLTPRPHHLAEQQRSHLEGHGARHECRDEARAQGQAPVPARRHRVTTATTSGSPAGGDSAGRQERQPDRRWEKVLTPSL